MLMKALGKTRWIIESLGEMLQYCNSRMGAYIEILPGSSTGSKGVGCFASRMHIHEVPFQTKKGQAGFPC